MEENRTTPEAGAVAQARYCALEYRSPDSGCALPEPGEIVILLLAVPGKPPLVLVNPQWRRICRPADHAYFEELFRDFAERVRVDAEALFAQASELSVGPLITHCAGGGPEIPGWLRDLRDRFMAG
jgi:hypothetical protein